MAAIFADLAGGELSLPPRVAVAADRGREEGLAEDGLADLLWQFWWGFKSRGWLTRTRAVVLANGLLVRLREPIQLLRLRRECRELRLTVADGAIERAIEALDPGFLDNLHRLPIDRAFLAAHLRPVERTELRIACYRSGRIRLVSSRRASCRLELAETSASGTFTQEGVRGGSGFIIRETYRDGAARGTLNSPWHDGDETTDAIEWPLWVAESLRSVAEAR